VEAEGGSRVPAAQSYPPHLPSLCFLPGRENISWPVLFLPFRFQKAGAPVTPSSPPCGALPVPRELGLK
jgi:hypothetical protein